MAKSAAQRNMYGEAAESYISPLSMCAAAGNEYGYGYSYYWWYYGVDTRGCHALGNKS